MGRNIYILLVWFEERPLVSRLLWGCVAAGLFMLPGLLLHERTLIIAGAVTGMALGFWQGARVLLTIIEGLLALI